LTNNNGCGCTRTQYQELDLSRRRRDGSPTQVCSPGKQKYV
jgi:hypothetical protein